MIKIVISAITGQEEGPKKRKKPNKKANGDKKSRKHAHREDSDEGNSSEESGNDGDGNEDDGDSSDLFPEFDSAPSQNTCGQKQVYLGISFWIVIDAPYSCMSDIDTNIRQLLQEWKFRSVHGFTLPSHQGPQESICQRPGKRFCTGFCWNICRDSLWTNYA